MSFLLIRLREIVLPYNLEVATLQGDVNMRTNLFLFPRLGEKKFKNISLTKQDLFWCCDIFVEMF